jgi:hypothetical protein
MKHSSDNSFDGTSQGVTTEAMDYLFVAVAVFLGGKHQRYCSGLTNIVQGACCSTDQLGSAVELDIAKAEGGIVAGGACVFAWSKQEEEGDGNHVSDGHVAFDPCLVEGSGQDVEDDCDGNWLDPCGRGVYQFPASEHTRDSEVYFAKGVFADVFGPHAGELLAHRS